MRPWSRTPLGDCMTVQTPRRAPSPDRDAQRALKPTRPAGPTKAPRGRTDPLWAKLTLIFGAVLMLVSGVGIVGGKVLIGSAIGAVTQQNLLGGTKKTLAEGGDSLTGPIDILLMGVDARKRWAV